MLNPALLRQSYIGYSELWNSEGSVYSASFCFTVINYDTHNITSLSQLNTLIKSSGKKVYMFGSGNIYYNSTYYPALTIIWDNVNSNYQVLYLTSLTGKNDDIRVNNLTDIFENLTIVS